MAGTRCPVEGNPMKKLLVLVLILGLAAFALSQRRTASA
jgi:hypothetical protein